MIASTPAAIAALNGARCRSSAGPRPRSTTGSVAWLSSAVAP